MKTIYSCEEHVDEAMDDLLDEFETFPVVYECTNEVCIYCSNKSKYKIEINNE